jgi:hypothetical protein
MKTFAEQGKKGLPLSVKDDAQYKALLDETMGDKRMQKEARAGDLLAEAWKQKGQEFQNDNRHDASKLDQINDFKKVNADITKSSGLIVDWDDAKGLNDDALKDADVQTRLREVKSTVKGIDDKFMNAFDAIEGGYAGVAKQKALSTGEAERYERMNDQELARVSVKMLSEQSTSQGIARAIEASMRTGDEGRARTLMSHLGARVQGGKTPSDREQAFSAMRGAAGSVNNMQRSAGTTTHFNRVTRAAAETERRRMAESLAAHLRSNRTTPAAGAPAEAPTPVVVEQTEDQTNQTLVAEQTTDSEAATVIAEQAEDQRNQTLVAEQEADVASQTIVPPRT